MPCFPPSFRVLSSVGRVSSITAAQRTTLLGVVRQRGKGPSFTLLSTPCALFSSGSQHNNHHNAALSNSSEIANDTSPIVGRSRAKPSSQSVLEFPTAEASASSSNELVQQRRVPSPVEFWNPSEVHSTISPEMTETLNAQANWELWNSQLYTAASFWFLQRNFRGFAKKLRADAEEERAHAFGIFEHIQARNGKLELSELPRPMQGWKTPSEVFSALAKTELDNLDRLSNIVRRARENSDFQTEILMATYVKQQTADVDKITFLLSRVQTANLLPGLLFSLDAQLEQA